MTNEVAQKTMLFEGAVDAVQCLKLLRLGIVNDMEMADAIPLIDATICELNYAISASLDSQEAA